MIQTDYLESMIKQFAYYRMLGEKAMQQVDDAALVWQYNAESNSIAIIVQHLWGNMRSRWTDFLASDGEKPWREREAEFESVISSRTELMEKWNEGWACLFAALHALQPEDLEKTVYIRNMGHSVVEAINRQLAHYAYHVGQIVYIARMMSGSGWQSLSIPKGGSEAYNSEKFAQPRHKEHFTDEFTKGEQNKQNK